MKILNIKRTITNRGTIKYWFTVEGKVQPTYLIHFELSGKEIIDEGCDCIYESNNRFGKEKKCKHLTHCEKAVKNIIRDGKRNNDKI